PAPRTEDVHEELGAPGAHEAADPEDLTSTDVEGDALEHPLAVVRTRDRQIAHAEDRLARRLRAPREELVDLATDHLLDDRALRRLRGAHRADALAVAEDGDAIRDREDLLEA